MTACGQRQPQRQEQITPLAAGRLLHSSGPRLPAIGTKRCIRQQIGSRCDKGCILDHRGNRAAYHLPHEVNVVPLDMSNAEIVSAAEDVYQRLIEAGKKSAKDIISTVETKGMLSEDQKQLLFDAEVEKG